MDKSGKVTCSNWNAPVQNQKLKNKGGTLQIYGEFVDSCPYRRKSKQIIIRILTVHFPQQVTPDSCIIKLYCTVAYAQRKMSCSVSVLSKIL